LGVPATRKIFTRISHAFPLTKIFSTYVANLQQLKDRGLHKVVAYMRFLLLIRFHILRLFKKRLYGFLRFKRPRWYRRIRFSGRAHFKRLSRFVIQRILSKLLQAASLKNFSIYRRLLLTFKASFLRRIRRFRASLEQNVRYLHRVSVKSLLQKLLPNKRKYKLGARRKVI